MRVGILYHPKGNPKGNQPWIFNWKDWCWSSNTLATWCQELTHWKRPWCWERLKAGGEGDDRRWDGWMASPTQWTWVWVNSRSWCWTGSATVHGATKTRLSDWNERNRDYGAAQGFKPTLTISVCKWSHILCGQKLSYKYTGKHRNKRLPEWKDPHRGPLTGYTSAYFSSCTSRSFSLQGWSPASFRTNIPEMCFNILFWLSTLVKYAEYLSFCPFVSAQVSGIKRIHTVT